MGKFIGGFVVGSIIVGTYAWTKGFAAGVKIDNLVDKAMKEATKSDLAKE